MELRPCNSLIRNDGIVLERASEAHAIRALVAAWRQGVGNGCFVNDGFALLGAGKAANELQSDALLVVEQANPGMGARVGISGLRTHEGGRERHLCADDEAGKTQMMAK